MPKRGLIIGLSAATVAIIAIVLLSITSTRLAPETPSASDWQSNWAVQTGFDINIDARGFRFPTAIAFVPDPGKTPKSPLYFVVELRGGVKVVTNDRSVFTFAEGFFTLRPKRVNPTIDQSVGMAGICLSPDQGYLFVTFSYHDANDILRNNIVRFQSTPQTYSLAPTSQIAFTEVFASEVSAPSHQIGPCQIKDGLLYVSVADANQPKNSQRMDSLLGKILRMTFEGRPAPENPFYQDDDISNPQNYIWASGLRNPFGLKIVGDQVFVSDNGGVIDRFLQVREGGNYLWDGTDMSIGTNADVVFNPGRGVAQLDSYPPNYGLFPDRFKDSFFLTMTSSPLVRREGFPAIWIVPYDFSQGKLTAVPKNLLRYRGQQIQMVAGLGFGPDGLYFAPIVPSNGESSPVFKIKYAPEANYPFALEEDLNPVVLMNTHGCLACHSTSDDQVETIGPTLDRSVLVPKLTERLNSEAHSNVVRELDQLNSEPFVSFRDARQEIARAEDLEKIRLWIYNRILEPRFDDPNAGMPRLGLSTQQAKAIADYLSGAPEETAAAAEDRGVTGKATDLVNDVIIRPLQLWLPYPTRENSRNYLIAMFGIGFLTGVVVIASSLGLFLYRRRSRNLKEAE